MAGVSHEDAAASFDPLRPKLMRVAYRMLGSMAAAEDMVEEALDPLDGGPTAARCVNPKRSCAARSRASLLISSSLRDASARPMSARGFPILSSKRRSRRTLPCRWYLRWSVFP